MTETSTNYFPSSAPDGHWPWRLWQALVMPVFYPLFGLGCLWLYLLTFLPRSRASVRERALWLRRQFGQLSRRWLRLGALLGLLDHRVIDQRGEAATPDQGKVMLANHPSLVDVLFVLAEMPELCCVLKDELRRVPLLGRLINALDYMSNVSPEALLDEGERRLAAGESLLIFPEGTRTKGRSRLRFRPGAAELSLRTGAAVQPIVIHYHGRYLSGLDRWYHLPRKRLRYEIEIPEPVLPPTTSGASRRQVRRRFNSALERGFEARLNRRCEGSPRFARTAEPTPERNA